MEPARANPVLIVGVGASAGGLDAFRRLLRHVEPGSGLALVFVQHLDPGHESILAHLLAPATSMTVREVVDGVAIEPDHVYIIPPRHDVDLGDGRLRLVPRGRNDDGMHLPIDFFLRALAEIQGDRAIGVLLSGTGADGTLGLEAIRARGGITLVQDPASAMHDAMPLAAIAAGCVDFVRTPEQIARELTRLGYHPSLAAPSPAEAPGEVPGGARDSPALERILQRLGRVTGLDFRSSYKRPTILRRIARRMVLRNVASLVAYARSLEQDPEEVQALSNDCLILVTSFFRNPETLRTLREKVFPLLLDGGSAEEPLRAWVAGSATGEEAYSLAITYLELTADRASSRPLQIFATDVSGSAIAHARIGAYPETIARDVSAERLERFFVRTGSSYQIKKSVRDLCVFSRHDLTQDPPFSRIDLILCQNVLIYLESRAQERVIANFQYALNSPGFLVLGPSETAGASAALLERLDPKQRIYSKVKSAGGSPLVLPSLAGKRTARSKSGGAPEAPAAPQAVAARGAPPSLAGQADRILLGRYSPAAVLVDEHMRVIEFRGDTHPYLAHGLGRATLDLTRLARRGLQLPLRAVIARARKTGAASRVEDLQVRFSGRLWPVTIEVIPLGAAGQHERGMLVVFESPDGDRGRSPRTAAVRSRPRSGDAKDRLLEQLGHELAETEEHFHAVIQEQESLHEELQSSNEESLSSNEELRSLNEELQTAKEEVQSANEELVTLNQELQERNVELERLGDDLLNLLASIDLPLAMFGGDSRLRRFTSKALNPLNLRAGDVGRPVGDIRSNLVGADVEGAIAEVIRTASATTTVVRDREGRHHEMRIHPYRTGGDKIDGAVLVLFDIDALKRKEEQVQHALDYANGIVETLRTPLLVLDADLRVERANRSFFDSFNIPPDAVLGRRLHDVDQGQWDIPDLRQALGRTPPGQPLDAIEVTRDFPRTGSRTVVFSGRRFRVVPGEPPRLLLAIEDRTEIRKVAEEREALLVIAQRARSQAEEADRVKDQFIDAVAHELRGPLNVMMGWIGMLRGGMLEAKTTGRALDVIDRSVHSQARLIEDLLDVSRVSTGRLRISRRSLDLVAMSRGIVETMLPAAEAKGLRLELELETPEAAVLCDPDRMHQILMNLVTNAVKFTPPGGRIEVRLLRDGDHHVLRVADDGVGIAPDFLPHVFERFRQADGGTTRRYAGVGLGLAIAKHLVELHGGTIEAHSPGLGRGATFTVGLPRSPLPADRAATELIRARHEVDSGGMTPVLDRAAVRGLSILLVEDDEAAREALIALLSASGARVTAVASASEAVQELERQRPDVLVSDIGMPDADGYSLLRRVRELDPENGGRLPALALTAYAGDRFRRMALDAGFDDHLTKPAEPVDLIAAVARLARRPA